MKVVRILVYEGSEDRVEQVLARSLLDGNNDFGGIVISVATMPIDATVKKTDVWPFGVDDTLQGTPRDAKAN